MKNGINAQDTMDVGVNTLFSLYRRMIEALEVEGLEIPLTAVKFFRHEEDIPDVLNDYAPDTVSLTSYEDLEYLFRYLPEILYQLRGNESPAIRPENRSDSMR